MTGGSIDYKNCNGAIDNFGEAYITGGTIKSYYQGSGNYGSNVKNGEGANLTVENVNSSSSRFLYNFGNATVKNSKITGNITTMRDIDLILDNVILSSIDIWSDSNVEVKNNSEISSVEFSGTNGTLTISNSKIIGTTGTSTGLISISQYKSGTINLEEGTIIDSEYSAISNSGTMILNIGKIDGIVNSESPKITG